MRLLKLLSDGTFQLSTFDNDDPPPYAILSHTWTEGQEVTFQELEDGAGKNKTGFDKIRFCGKQAAAAGLEYFWVDTCCIDKTSSYELGTAINYMFRWYQRSSKCYVYLSDVSAPEADAAMFPITWMEAFRRSRWFKRGWTLQELIAPASVEFFSSEHKLLGNKKNLVHEVSKITGIPTAVLRGQSPEDFSFEARMSWMSSRETTVKEDRYYCLLGIFDVFLAFIPGEGERNAKMRLEEEIQKRQRRHGANQSNLDMAHHGVRRPAFVVPFTRDPDFVDRGTLTNQLREMLSRPMSRVALVGIGGVGKSQLSLQYCYQTRGIHTGMHILWAHASNAARLEESFRDIADHVKIEGRQDSQANIFKLVHDWLCDIDEPWLLVLDNVDDASFLLDAQAVSSTTTAKTLREYLPRCDHGSILVTSRNKEAALQLVEEADIIALHPMEAPQAQALLEKKLKAQAPNFTTAELVELADVLEYMPLALSQAAAYISHRAPFISVAKYLDQFKTEHNRMRLLESEEGQKRRDREAKNSIVTTWHISFEHIQQKWPTAAKLLSLMSFFDRQSIPKYVLQMKGRHENEEAFRKINEARKGSHEKETRVQSHNEGGVEEEPDEIDAASMSDLLNDSEDDDVDDDAFIEDVTVLRNFAFVSVSSDATTFEMHALMQLSMRTWLAENGTLERHKGRFINKLRAAFPPGRYKNWATCQALFAHAKAAADQKPESALSSVQWAELMYRAAWYARAKGNSGEAETLAMLSLRAKENVLGPEHEDTVWNRMLLARCYLYMGKLDAAEVLQIQVVKFCEVNFGLGHRDTLAAISELAMTRSSQGRLNEAEKLFTEVIEGSNAALKENPTLLLNSKNRLAMVYVSQNRIKEAESLQLQVVEASKTIFGQHHPDTLHGIYNLASTYKSQGRLEEAESLQLQVVEAFKVGLGPQHPDTLISMYGLAYTWKLLDRNAEAVALMKQCVQGRQKALKADHPDLLKSLRTLKKWRAEQAETDLIAQAEAMRISEEQDDQEQV